MYERGVVFRYLRSGRMGADGIGRERDDVRERADCGKLMFNCNGVTVTQFNAFCSCQ